jgi:hypothetical protein
MDRRSPVAILALVLVFLTAAGAVVAVPNAQLTVSDVTVDPGEPVAGEPVTITPTIASSVGSDEPVTIDSVNATVDGEEIGAVENEGTLSPGDSVSVPLTTTFDEPGEYAVNFTIVGTDDAGEQVTLTRRETVVVSPVPAVRLTVSDVAVEPATPTVGEPVTVPITVASSAGSTQPVEVDAVTLLDGDERVASATDLGALATGDSITVPLTTTFDSVGERTLTARLRGTNARNETVTVTRPVTVVVEQGAPAVEMTTNATVAGVPATIPMTVSNPTEATLRNIVVTLGGEGVVGEIDRRVVPSLDPGEATGLSFRLRPSRAGEALVEANVSYTTAAGTRATTSMTDTLPVDPLEESVSVRVSSADAEQETQDTDLGVGVEGILDGGGNQQSESDSSEGDVRVTVSNLGNAPLRNVVLDPRVGEESLGARPVTDSLAPGSEESVIVSLERTPPSEVVFEATYDVAADSSNAVATFDPAGTRGGVAVTGVDLETSGQRLEITGDIGNPGGSEVSGVVVSVDAAEGVSPAYPRRDFFVGAIDGDGFAPFELTATIDENATSVPVTVEYVVAGDQRTETVEFPIEDGPDSDDGGGNSPVLVGTVVAMLGSLLAAIVLFARRE